MEGWVTQDSLFISGEGDNWYRRNRSALDNPDKLDWPLHLFDLLGNKEAITSVIELGCSNGFRLAKFKREYLPNARCVGVDASTEAISTGKSLFPEVELYHGTISAPPVEGHFDLVVVNYVLHWVDRSQLSRSLAAVDCLVKDGGLLLLGDFLPDYPQRRRYHHRPEEQVFTYKQNYSASFLALGLYREMARLTYDHDGASSYELLPVDSQRRGVCTLQVKSLNGYYPEV